MEDPHEREPDTDEWTKIRRSAKESRKTTSYCRRPRRSDELHRRAEHRRLDESQG